MRSQTISSSAEASISIAPRAFGGRPALITGFTEHAPGLSPDGREMNGAYRMLNYDFVMTRSGR
jgi:hypothetical protein